MSLVRFLRTGLFKYGTASGTHPDCHAEVQDEYEIC